MVRVLSYNILLGGMPRLEPIYSMLQASQADIIGLVEATSSHVVEELASRLGMQFCLSGHGRWNGDWQLALLSRFPITHTSIHTHPDIFTRKHLLEAQIETPEGYLLTVFIIHLTAGFHRGRYSSHLRRAEVQTALKIMEKRRDTPHLLMGDFNSIAPGDRLLASNILRYMLRLREQEWRNRRKQAFSAARALPTPTYRERILTSLLHALVSNYFSSSLLDYVSPIGVRGGIDLLLKAGYVDSFRHLHGTEPGFTFPSIHPSCRIDYLFSSPELATRLMTCQVLTEGIDELPGHEASDHLPIFADFT